MKLVSFEWKKVEYQFKIGRDKHENWELIDDSKPNDIWFHVDGAPSSHVVLEMDEFEWKQIPLAVLKRGAGLCKEHSKSKSVAKCVIMYTRIENLKKGREIGSVTISGDVKYITL